MIRAHQSAPAAAVLLFSVPLAAQPCTPQWTPFLVGGGSPDWGVEAILVEHDSSGAPTLTIGGSFENIAGIPVGRIAQYRAGQWTAFGSGIPFSFNSHGFQGCCARVSALAPAPTGPDHLYIGGDFIQSGGVQTESIARWEGAAGGWHDLSGGLAFNPSCMDCPPRVLDLVPSGTSSLYVIGSFEFAGGTPANHIAQWNGTSFSALGGGLSRRAGETSPVWSSAGILFDDGSGPSLFIAGYFSRAGNIDALNIARWDGQSWHPVGAGITQPSGGPAPTVNALAIYDNGAGPQLHAAGYFLEAGGSPARHIARWDGQSWHPLGAGIGDNPNDQVYVLETFNDGDGDALYAGGKFEVAGGLPARNIARWRNNTWSALGDGLDDQVNAMAVYDDGITTSLLIGGWFTTAGGLPSPYIATWTGCLPPGGACPPNCDHSTTPPILNIDDFTCFVSEFAAAQSLPPAQQLTTYANCDDSTTSPVLNVDDFTCFINQFAAGCP